MPSAQHSRICECNFAALLWILGNKNGTLPGSDRRVETCRIVRAHHISTLPLTQRRSAGTGSASSQKRSNEGNAGSFVMQAHRQRASPMSPVQRE